MQFIKLYEMQAELDREIHLNHNTGYEQTFNRRLMAILVELGEFANETRCFKYWSLKGPSAHEIVLEEYIDGIHFILSLGISIGSSKELEFTPIVSEDNLTDVFLKVYQLASDFKMNHTVEDYKVLFETYLGLGMKLGFNEEMIIDAYIKKNSINHERQNNAY